MKRIALCTVWLLLLLAPIGHAWAGPILLQQSDGTTTPLGGNGDAAKVDCSNCGGGGGGGAVTIADGAAVAVGATTDAAVTTNTTGTLSAKLRGLVAIFADIWNSTAHTVRVTMTDSAGNEVVVPTAGLTHYLASAATTNATSVKATAGTLYGLSLSNTATTVYYLRLYNLAAAPTCSSATGYVESIPIPPASAAGQVGGREMQFNIGKAFTTGIAYCITGGAGNTDNTAAAVGVFVSGLYK